MPVDTCEAIMNRHQGPSRRARASSIPRSPSTCVDSSRPVHDASHVNKACRESTRSSSVLTRGGKKEKEGRTTPLLRSTKPVRRAPCGGLRPNFLTSFKFQVFSLSRPMIRCWNASACPRNVPWPCRRDEMAFRAYLVYPWNSEPRGLPRGSCSHCQAIVKADAAGAPPSGWCHPRCSGWDHGH